MKRSGWTIGSMVVAVLLVAACSTSSGAAVPAARSAPAVVPAAATTPAVVASLPDGMFTGHSVCRDTTPFSGSMGVSGEIKCERTASDPRMAGTLVNTYRVDRSHPTVTTISTEGTLTNDGGSWTCKSLLMGQSGGSGGEDEICTGRGGYVGLIEYSHGVSGNDAVDNAILGWIVDSSTWDLAPASK